MVAVRGNREGLRVRSRPWLEVLCSRSLLERSVFLFCSRCSLQSFVLLPFCPHCVLASETVTATGHMDRKTKQKNKTTSDRSVEMLRGSLSPPYLTNLSLFVSLFFCVFIFLFCWEQGLLGSLHFPGIVLVREQESPTMLLIRFETRVAVGRGISTVTPYSTNPVLAAGSFQLSCL